MPPFDRPGPSLAFDGLTISSLLDGWLDIPADYFPDASPSEKRLVSPAARFGSNVWLVETPTRRVLVDAGSGSWLKQRFPETGQLGLEGKDSAVTATAITDVVLTHMHADHIGGLVAADGSLFFPDAQIHVQQAEWAFWTDEALGARSPEGMRPMIGLIQMLAHGFRKQVTRHEGEVDLGEGLRLQPAPGHTPGHQIVHLSGGNRELLLLGDAVVSQDLQFANPDAAYALESDPALAANTRRTLFARIARDGIAFAATHMRTAGFCGLSGEGDGYRLQPIEAHAA